MGKTVYVKKSDNDESPYVSGKITAINLNTNSPTFSDTTFVVTLDNNGNDDNKESTRTVTAKDIRVGTEGVPGFFKNIGDKNQLISIEK